MLIMVRRIYRILRAGIAIVSLLLFQVVVVLWIRSYFIADRFYQYSTYDLQNRSHRPIFEVQIGKGGISFCRDVWTGPIGSLDGLQSQALIHRKGPPQYPDLRFRPSDPPIMGFQFRHFTGSIPAGPTGKIFAFMLPLWSLSLLFLLLALPEVLYRYRRYQRTRHPHLCRNCGYDLRASPDRCPECGEATTISRPVSPIVR
jgi:hypothetical protein